MTIRVVLPAHLRVLARVPGGEVTVEVTDGPTQSTVLDALEAKYPALEGTLRDHVTKVRRPFVRFFACSEDLSHDSADAPLPEAVCTGKEAFWVVGAIAGGSLGDQYRESGQTGAFIDFSQGQTTADVREFDGGREAGVGL